MADRYGAQPMKFNFSNSGAFGAGPAMPQKQTGGLDDFLRLAGGVAPALGAVGGGLLGTFAAPGLGTAAGAALGGAAGSALGGAANFGADEMDTGYQRQQAEWMREQQERQARSQAAMHLLGGL